MTPKEKAEAIKKQLVVINQLLKKPENKLCADCKKINPTWASVNLGVFVCINCSGCHREIGVHITKIRSVNLDVWPQEVLNNFKIINNKIANKYWECKLKNFNFKSIQGDNHKLVQFIRDKYENKKWIDSKKKIDPMTLIIKGKIKKYKKLFCESEDEEEDEEEDQSDDDRKNKKNKNKKKKKDKDVSEDEEDDNKHKKKKKNNKDDDSEDSDEEEDKGKKKKKEDNDEEDDDDEEGNDDEENEEDDNKNKKNKNKNDEEEDDDFEEVKEKKIYESKSPITQRPPQLSNNLLFEMNLNQNKQNNLNLNFNNNNANSANNLSLNNNNNNIVDIFNQQTPADKKSQDLMNNINNAYFSPQPTNSSRFNSMFQQMPNNMGLNLQNKNNNIQNNNMNNYQNMGSNNNIMNINHVHNMQNVHMNMNNNNMYNMNNNMNYGMNNFAGMNNNMNSMNNGMQNNMNNNMNFNNNNNNLKHTTSSTIPSNNPSFNMEYFNQNLTGGKKNKAESTYNFSKNKVDPFSNLVSFKK